MMELEYGLGWRADLEDPEELVYYASDFEILAPFHAPDSIDPRSWLSIENQGRMGSCSGHAMSTCCEVLNWIDTQGQVVQLSRMFAYLAGQKHCGLLGRDAGATISGSVKGAKENGICKEETFPYTGNYSTDIPQRAHDEAADHKIKKHVVLRDYSQVYNWLASGVGVVHIGIPWKSSLADAGGIIERSSGQTYGGHALAIVGYATKADSQGRKYPIMINSHSERWGENGTALVAPSLFDQWGRDNGSELIGVSDLEEFAPRGLNWIGRLFG